MQRNILVIVTVQAYGVVSKVKFKKKEEEEEYQSQ